MVKMILRVIARELKVYLSTEERIRAADKIPLEEEIEEELDDHGETNKNLEEEHFEKD